MNILPAILPKDFSEIEEKVSLVTGIADMVQVDICDGKFVTSTTWPYKRKDQNFEELLHEERGLPSWEDINYEFDLMIQEPTEHDARQWLSVGARNIVLHAESSKDLTPVMNILKGLVEIGLALNITTPIESIEQYKDLVSYVQLMGITRVGFQGQAFDPRVLAKIKEVKEKYPHLRVQVDGGVSLATADDLKTAGVDTLVVGSTLFTSDNIVDTYRQLER